MHQFHLAKDRVPRNKALEELQRQKQQQEARLSQPHAEASPYVREQREKYGVKYTAAASLGVVGNIGAKNETMKKKTSTTADAVSVASTLSSKKYPTSPTNRPNFVVGTLSPQDSMKLTSELETRVLKKISNTVYGDGDSDIKYPVKLPEARYQLIELHGILDEMINETRYEQQVLLSSDATVDTTKQIVLFNTEGNFSSTLPTVATGAAATASATQGSSANNSTQPTPTAVATSSSGVAKGTMPIPAAIVINKNIPGQPDTGSSSGKASASGRSPVPARTLSPVPPGSRAEHTYTHPVNEKFLGRDGSRVDSISQNVKSNMVRQIYNGINASGGGGSMRPLDGSVAGLEQRAQKFSFDMILAQLTKQAVIKAKRLHKYYRKHLVAVEKEYHLQMERMEKQTELCMSKLSAYESKEKASQQRVKELLRGPQRGDSHHYESTILLPEIDQYITGGRPHTTTGTADKPDGEIAELLAKQLQTERHNNSRYIEELTEEVDALQKKFNVAVQANRKMQEELEDKDLEVEDLKERMHKQRENAESEISALKSVIAAHQKQKNMYDEARIQRRESTNAPVSRQATDPDLRSRTNSELDSPKFGGMGSSTRNSLIKKEKSSKLTR